MSYVYGDGVSMNYLKSAHLVSRRVLSDVGYCRSASLQYMCYPLRLRHFNNISEHESQITANLGNILVRQGPLI
jgi:hypothetical protein